MMMKYLNQNLVGWAAGVALAVLLVAGCKPEVCGELGEPFDKIEGMTGTWQLTSFSQKDLNSPVKEVRDLSSFYIDGITTPLELTFTADGTYAVALEMGKNYFGDGGMWSFDDPNFPTYLELYSSDTLVYNLGGIVRPFDNELNIEYRRECSSTPTVVYTFSFNRQN